MLGQRLSSDTEAPAGDDHFNALTIIVEDGLMLGTKLAAESESNEILQPFASKL